MKNKYLKVKDTGTSESNPEANHPGSKEEKEEKKELGARKAEEPARAGRKDSEVTAETWNWQLMVEFLNSTHIGMNQKIQREKKNKGRNEVTTKELFNPGKGRFQTETSGQTAIILGLSTGGSCRKQVVIGSSAGREVVDARHDTALTSYTIFACICMIWIERENVECRM